MPLLVGIDEAGYGPMLGPLVVAASVWQAAPDAADACLWARLDDAVCREPRRKGDWRLVVNDSKAAFDRKAGIHTLERSVLAFARLAGAPVAALDGWLTALGAPIHPASRSACPWYADLSPPLPRDPARSNGDGVVARLESSLRAAGLRCTALMAQVITEDYYNTRLAPRGGAAGGGRSRNKADLLLEQVMRLIARAAATGGDDRDVLFRIDRLGGRTSYRDLLMQCFPQRRLHEEEVSETCSRYRLSSPQNDWQIGFYVEGDQRFLPVALASMTAKYTRELLMERFNGWWKQRCPQVRPTAGYYQDAQRFLAEIGPALPASGLAPAQFVRCS
ncbi:hypothetical protein RAS1_25160 [Phycisphaerae bacterium RAS1]|nr:hypothetical protein RAS1_25160 [Phycisphaerae bacterium RAS1]